MCGNLNWRGKDSLQKEIYGKRITYMFVIGSGTQKIVRGCSQY